METVWGFRAVVSRLCSDAKLDGKPGLPISVLLVLAKKKKNGFTDLIASYVDYYKFEYTKYASSAFYQFVD